MWYHFCKFWICASLILFGYSAHADWRIEQYLATAIENNSEVKAAFENWQAALSKVAYSNSLPDPKITYGHFIKSVESRVGPQKFRLGVAQMIPWLGKLSARKDLASQQANFAEAQLKVAYATLRKDLIEAFLDLRFLRRAVSIQKDYIYLARSLEQTAQSQSKVGGSRADVIQSQMELHRLDYELNSLKEKLAVTSKRIEALLNERDGSLVSLPTDIEDYLSSHSRDLEQLSEALLHKS